MTIRLLPLGDSITFGQGAEATGGYREPLYRALRDVGYDVRMVGSVDGGQPAASPSCEGHCGGTARDLIARVVDLGRIEAAAPDFILLMIGVNALKADSSPRGIDRVVDDLATLLEGLRARAPRAHVIVSSIPPTTRTDAVTTYNRRVEELARSRADDGASISFVDLHAVVTLDHLPDGLHPHAEGYARLARGWFEALRPRVGDPRNGLAKPPY